MTKSLQAIRFLARPNVTERSKDFDDRLDLFAALGEYIAWRVAWLSADATALLFGSIQMFKRTFAGAAVAASLALMSGPALAQAQGGLVNVNISDIEVEIEDVLSDNQVAVNIPVVVQVPVTLAANVCNLSVAAVLAIAQSGGECDADADATNTAEARAIAGLIRRP